MCLNVQTELNQGVEGCASMRWYGHHMHVMLPYFLKKCKAIHMTLMGVNNEKVGVAQFTDFGKVLKLV